MYRLLISWVVLTAAVIAQPMTTGVQPAELREPFNEAPYWYEATVVSTYDADTTTLLVDLGFSVTLKQKFRLYGIDAWEVRGAERVEGLVARDYLRSRMPPGTTVHIRTIKDKRGKYGRYLCVIWVEDELGKMVNLNNDLVAKGHAEFALY